MPRPRDISLAIICIVGMVCLTLVMRFGVEVVERPDAAVMREARDRAAQWFEIIVARKDSLGLIDARMRNPRWLGLLGDEYSDFTTTLGSVEAKETTLNPDFAAMVVRILDDEGYDTTHTVAITHSGSFPAIGISALAALQTLGIRTVMVTSLGASSYGANQPGATWLDYERWLADEGGSWTRSAIVTYGAEGDTGGGIVEEGLRALDVAAQRTGIRIFIPKTLREGIDARVRLFGESGADLLINIGGSQAALGGCVHATTLPNGFHRRLDVCEDDDRGVIAEMAARGVPVLHFLNIKDLALRYGLPLTMSGDADEQGSVLTDRVVSRVSAAAALVLICILLFAAAKCQKCRFTGGA